MLAGNYARGSTGGTALVDYCKTNLNAGFTKLHTLHPYARLWIPLVRFELNNTAENDSHSKLSLFTGSVDAVYLLISIDRTRNEMNEKYRKSRDEERHTDKLPHKNCDFRYEPLWNVIVTVHAPQKRKMNSKQRETNDALMSTLTQFIIDSVCMYDALNVVWFSTISLMKKCGRPMNHERLI